MSTTQEIRAPQADGVILAVPALSETGNLLEANRQRLRTAPISLLGRPLDDLRRQARQDTVAAAAAYLRQAGESLPPFPDGPLLLAGHQPELFHPGVWIKSFALHGLARRHGLVPLNLIVDNDTLKTTTLRLPARLTGDETSPSWRLASIPFDTWGGEIPFEERPVQDEALFASFAVRAGEVLADWGVPSLLPAFWAEILRQAKRTPFIGERFAAARRTWERRWQCYNLELPISHLCRLEAFAWFACHILADLPRFHRIYNRILHEHRQRHGLRSQNHPVPDLISEDQWLEVPFWVWRSGTTKRGRLFARPTVRQVELRVPSTDGPSLPLSGKPQTTIAAFRELEKQGFKVRPRALTTTLFARLILGDLFIHGIGGGKYDELTDEIMRQFYGVEPLAFLILSATLWLPLPRFPVNPDQRRRLRHQLRDLHYNPQRYLVQASLTQQDSQAGQLVQEKWDWINEHPQTRQQRRRRFEALRALNERMWPYVSGPERKTLQQLVRVESQLESNAVLQRRDYAFCLFPEEKLRDFFVPFMEGLCR